MVPIQNENDGKVLGVLTEGTFALTPLYLPLSVLSCPVLHFLSHPVLFSLSVYSFDLQNATSNLSSF